MLILGVIDVLKKKRKREEIKEWFGGSCWGVIVELYFELWILFLWKRVLNRGNRRWKILRGNRLL